MFLYELFKFLFHLVICSKIRCTIRFLYLHYSTNESNNVQDSIGEELLADLDEESIFGDF